MNGFRLRNLTLAAVILQLGAALSAHAVGSTEGTLINPGDDLMYKTWSSGYDSAGSSVATFENVTLNAKPALHLAYNFGTGTWVNFTSPTNGIPTTTGAFSNDTLTYWQKGEGLNNLYKIEIQDSNGVVYLCDNLQVVTAGWHQVTVPKSSFHFGWNVNGGSTSTINWNSIKKLGFTVYAAPTGGGGSGSLAIDDIRTLAGGGNTTTVTTLLDDGESAIVANAGTNNFGSTITERGTATLGRVTASPTPFAGSASRSVAVTTVPFSGIAEGLGTSFDSTPYNYLTFYVLVTSTVSGSLTAELQDTTSANGSQSVAMGGITAGAWTPVQIPLSSYAGSVNLASLKTVSFFLPNNSTLYFDQMAFSYVPVTSTGDVVVDNMDTLYTNAAWLTYQETGSSTTLQTVPGETGDALQLNFSFPPNPTGQWANMSRGFGLNVLENNSNAFHFDYMGIGKKNNLEFKVTDDTNTTFRLMLKDVTNTDGAWKTLVARYNDLQFFSGANTTLNYRNITKFEFALSKDLGDKGDFYVSSIYFFHNPDFQQVQPANRVIAEFSIDNNPFKPRTDALMSSATFTFTLNEEAKVWLKVYDLGGATLRQFDAGVLPAGTHSLTWDGLDKNNNLVRNGMYIYMFVAEGKLATQKIRNIIGVAR